jgi:hypothetical protein
VWAGFKHGWHEARNLSSGFYVKQIIYTTHSKYDVILMLMLFLRSSCHFCKKIKARPSLFFFKLNVLIHTCSKKWSVSLARIKIQLDFQSMEAFGQKLTNESKGDAYLHKFRPDNRFDHDVRQ